MWNPSQTWQQSSWNCSEHHSPWAERGIECESDHDLVLQELGLSSGSAVTSPMLKPKEAEDETLLGEDEATVCRLFLCE